MTIKRIAHIALVPTLALILLATLAVFFAGQSALVAAANSDQQQTPGRMPMTGTMPMDANMPQTMGMMNQMMNQMQQMQAMMGQNMGMMSANMPMTGTLPMGGYGVPRMMQMMGHMMQMMGMMQEMMDADMPMMRGQMPMTNTMPMTGTLPMGDEMRMGMMDMGQGMMGNMLQMMARCMQMMQSTSPMTDAMPMGQSVMPMMGMMQQMQQMIDQMQQMMVGAPVTTTTPATGTAASKLVVGLAQTAQVGAVTVKVTPLNLHEARAETLDFQVVLDTHSVELDVDLAKTATLRVGESELTPSAWEADSPKGHHVQGVLQFPATDVADADAVTLMIDGLPEQGTVTFNWTLNR